ncbi:MAG TPA: hypothetical protein PLY93_11895, partial [Turneriella sp.]|nr:hypothetical protein [Turneriella sp.]
MSTVHRVKKYRFHYVAFLLSLSTHILHAAPIGWGDAILVEPRAEEYSVCCHEGEGQLYAVVSRLKSRFVADQPTLVDIVLNYTQNGRFVSRVVSTVMLAPSGELFPLHPSVSALGNEILIAWQETSTATCAANNAEDSCAWGSAAGIYYVYSSSGPEGFGGKQALPATVGKLNAILPMAKMTAQGRHLIFYQEPTSGTRFMLSAATGGRGVFSGITPVAQISAGVRGALFPSALRRGNRIDIVYQNRAAATLIDDIFRGFSIDNGVTWSSNLRITENGQQNFSGKLTNTKDKLVFVWQSNPKKVWSIFAAPEGQEAIQVSDGEAPSYLPTIV